MPIRATISLVKPYASISHVAIAATDIKLRTGLLMEWFTDVVTLSEVAAILTSKTFTDGATVTDVSYVDLTKVAADSFTFSDTFNRTVVWSKSFSDAITLDDIAEADKNINANKTNIATLSDLFSFAFGTTFADSYSFSDLLANAVNKVETDSFSFSDSLSTTVVWSKAYSDSLSFSEAQAFAHSKSLSDGFTLDDATLVNKNYSGVKGNVFSLTESVSITRTHGRALGNMAFNAMTLN
jgi:hypothetical protein